MTRSYDNKFDKGKLRHDLVMPEVVEALAGVMTYGAEKYSPDSWKLVDDPANRYYSALLRHIYAYRRGEVNDQESQLQHLAHALANIQFLMYFEKEKQECHCMNSNVTNVDSNLKTS